MAGCFHDFVAQTCTFVIGNEGAGLSNKAIESASHQISIPMNKNLESLNAAAAAAVCLFERARQVIKK